MNDEPVQFVHRSSFIVHRSRLQMIKDVINDVQHRMHGAIEALHREFKTLRTGRANVAMLDGITVEYYGTPTPIAQVASLKVPEPSLIIAEPWDKSVVGAVEKAIRNADLGLNPSTDGKLVRIPIPQLTEERRKELVKRAHHIAEEARTAIRQVRRDGNDRLKKMLKGHEISEDDEKRGLDEIQKTTDKHIDEVGTVLKHKEADIMAV
jgi:ribosome recycling factor